VGVHVIDVAASIQCPHGGSVAVVLSQNLGTSVGGALATLVTDAMTIQGCANNVSGAPVPCLTIQWEDPAGSVSVGGAAVLLESSVGKCLNAAGAPQGTAIVNGAQTKVSGQ
jgi:hypothetical protein